MADWKNLTVIDVITEIESNKIVLPVIQRRLEWPEDKMEMLFDSLFRQNPFGSIICTEEARGLEPLFAHRLFTIDGSSTKSFMPERITSNLMLVIDGQQRLQSFYMGLCGNYNGKVLYYDLFSNYEACDYNFKFALKKEELPSRNTENSNLGMYFWYSVPDLFARLKALTNPKRVARKIIEEHNITDSSQRDYIENNVADFLARIFTDHSISISKVVARLSDKVTEDRQRITELFRRLNLDGMKLSTLDIVAATLKSFDYRMEDFIDKVSSQNSDIGIGKDELVKLLLILNDKPGKAITELSAQDAAFATENRKRIEVTLETLKKFLRASGHEEWFKGGKGAIKRSAIPLYFLAYHIFHHSCEIDEIEHMFDGFDVGKNENFSAMSLWLKVSLLNKALSGRNGWRPETTGVKTIHTIMISNKGKNFPVRKIFDDLYSKKLHKFYDEKAIAVANIDELDQDYVFYLIYRDTLIHSTDKDHIQPRSILERFSPANVNSIGNLQLLDEETNRVQKNNQPFNEWFEAIRDKASFIQRHLIPEDPELWQVSKFSEFLRERQKKIIAKIKASLASL